MSEGARTCTADSMRGGVAELIKHEAQQACFSIVCPATRQATSSKRKHLAQTCTRGRRWRIQLDPPIALAGAKAAMAVDLQQGQNPIQTGSPSSSLGGPQLRRPQPRLTSCSQEFPQWLWTRRRRSPQMPWCRWCPPGEWAQPARRRKRLQRTAGRARASLLLMERERLG